MKNHMAQTEEWPSRRKRTGATSIQYLHKWPTKKWRNRVSSSAMKIILLLELKMRSV